MGNSTDDEMKSIYLGTPNSMTAAVIGFTHFTDRWNLSTCQEF